MHKRANLSLFIFEFYESTKRRIVRLFKKLKEEINLLKYMINNIQLKRSNFKFINQDTSRISLLLLIQSDIHPSILLQNKNKMLASFSY